VWRNFTDNHATQHLMHRTTGYLLALSALAIATLALVRGTGAAKAAAIAVGVVGLVHRCAEQHQQAVANEVVHQPAILDHDIG
jgi:heme A synthase